MGTNPDKPSQPLGNLVDTDEIGRNSETTAAKQRPAHLFKPGQSGNPAGRPKGAKHKLGEDFLAALQADFSQHGVAAIAEVRESKPHEYLKVVASILPKDIDLNVTGADAFQRLWEMVNAGVFAGVPLPAEDVSRAEKAEGRPN